MNTKPAVRRETKNNGEHVIHTGGRYDSHLLVPVIPTRPSAGKSGSTSDFGVLFVRPSE